MTAGETIIEKEKRVPVRAKAEVIVAGGGLAGVAAAVASARAGAKTILIERNSFPGGVATAGMCCSVFNCFYTPGHELIVKGLPLEIVDRLAADGGGPGKVWHDHKGHIIYDVEKAKLVLAELLEEAGVDYLFETQISDTIIKDDVLQGVIIESKSGREAVLAGAVVDATGDADVAVRCGAPYFMKQPGDDHGAASFVFRVGGVDVDAFVDYFRQNPSEYPEGMDVDWTLGEALLQYEKTGTFLFPHGGGIQMKAIQKGVENGSYPLSSGAHTNLNALQMHAIRSLGVVHMITGFVDVSGLDVSVIGRSVTDGRRMAFTVCDYFRANIPGFEQAYVSQTADDLGIRISRWIDGGFVFTPEMKSTPSRCPDSIGRAVVERHFVKHGGKGAWSVQAFDEAYYQIPYRCLLPRGVDGLIMGAGRSVSAANPALLRVMVTTMTVGQGAGIAAAISAKSGIPLRSIDTDLLQAELLCQGVDL